MHGEPVGGRCLPKDLAQLITFAEEKGSVPELLKAVQRVNYTLTARVDEAGDDHPRPSELAEPPVIRQSTFSTIDLPRGT